MANPFIDQFLKFWKSTDFTDWNESDVREDFIAPILKLLGYAKNTVDHIFREQNLSLQEKYHRIGRKQIAIDYIPTVRLKKFWIIEAKPGSTKEMDFGDLLQAHFYAIHPEINARFIVMINGWEIRVYDALNSNDWDNYLLLCNQENCDTNFYQLIEVLGSNSMSSYLRKYILTTVRESLLVEIDVNAAESLKSEVFRIYMETMPVIRKNAKDLQMDAWRKNEAEQKELLQTMPLDHLLVRMDIPVDIYAKYGIEYARRIISAPENDRMNLYRKLMQRCYGRPHNVFRIQVVAALLHLLHSDIIIITDEKDKKDVADDLITVVKYNMTYWASTTRSPLDNISLVLCHLDNICCRIAYKSARRFAMEPLKDLVNAKLNTFSVKDLLINPPSVAREVVASVSIVQEMLWRRAMDQEAKVIWNNIWMLEDMEELIDTIPEVAYSGNDQDFLWFGQFGVDFDTLSVGTWMLIDEERDLLKMHKLDVNLAEFLTSTREEVMHSIPKSLTRPQNWHAPNRTEMSAIIERIRELKKQEQS